MNVFLNPIKAFFSGISYPFLAIPLYLLATALGASTVWGFDIIALPFYFLGMFIRCLEHPIGFIYIPASLYLMYKFFQGQTSLIFLFIVTFLVNCITVFITDRDIYIGKLNSLFILLIIACIFTLIVIVRKNNRA